MCEGRVELPDRCESREELDFEKYEKGVGFNMGTPVVKITDMKTS